MKERTINQIGRTPIYVERNEGKIYIGENYVEEPSSAFRNGSYELLDYTPTIEPAILREEVREIQEWIDAETSEDHPNRLALLYGKAGIGKSIVMHDLLEKLQSKDGYLVLGLKSDQVEFCDTDELSRKIHLAHPIEEVVKEMAQRYRRVILLIDQIDALSLSLSSNRTPLRSLLKVIYQVQDVPNVRVVISCRPYDLEYDPSLASLRIKKQWKLKELPKEQVLQTLKDNQFEERLSDNLLRFLGNPLHLYLFLKVEPERLTDPMSTDLLYHQLWRKYVTDDSVRRVDKDCLLALLDSLVDAMYSRQELSVHIREFETNYAAELRYLFTNGLLILAKSGQVQFFHQTLFDYVYARRFTERGYDLLSVLKEQHQGLFYRAAVKSILIFKREQNPSDYIDILEQLLYAKNENGKDLYRFHFKALALSNLAYFESPLAEELNFISRRVYSDKIYMDVIFESVYTAKWFNAIWRIIDSKGGWKKLSKAYKDKVLVMCQRTLLLDAEIVLDKLDSVLDYGCENDCKYLANLLQHYNLDCDSERLISIYNRLAKGKDPLEYTHLLNNILKGNPAFVCEVLKENIKLQLKEKEEKHIHKISVNYEMGHLYEKLFEKHHDAAIQLLMEILTIVYDASQIEYNGFDICVSTEFFSFERKIGRYLISDFVEDATNILIDDFLKNVEDENTKRNIVAFSKSKHEGLVFIALYVYTSRPDLFQDDVAKIIIARQVLANAPSWVKYQAVEALKVAFPLMSNAQKNKVIDRILAIDDSGEYLLFKYGTEKRLQYGHPILDIDLHKGRALSIIDKEDLKKLSWVAYQERQRIERKFNQERLKNKQPSITSTHIGWTSVGTGKGEKMSCDAWFKSMLAYTDDQLDWDRPSLTGQCQLFREVVSKDADKFVKLINQIILDDRIVLAYPQAGMQGLLDADRIEEAMHVLKGMLGVVNNDVNSTKRGFSILSLLFALSDIVEQEHVPEIVVQLFCNALINAKEPEEDVHRKDKDIYNVGINQARGNAGYKLVQCASRDDKYTEVVFDTLESIAETASVYTRAAILLNMAVLNRRDQNRNVVLFKKLMHDYNPRLMAMPVHNYNPLVYFVNYAIDDMMAFFYRAVECTECYREQVVILWLAWFHNNGDERIKMLVDKMCNTSQEARLSLLKFFVGLKDKINDAAVGYILHFMEPQFASPEMGEALDHLFYRIDKWSDQIQYKVTNAYIDSLLWQYQMRTFIGFLGGYAIKDPIQVMRWLRTMRDAGIPDDYFIWNEIADVVIQSYNGIRSFNNSRDQDALENAMDLIDAILQSPRDKYLISNFINKLDNE